MTFELNGIEALRILTFIIGLLTLIIGFYVIHRCSGKIRNIMYLIISATILLEIKKFIALNLSEQLSMPYRALIDLGIIMCLFFVTYNIKKMINDYDKEHRGNIISSASVRKPRIEAYN